jgi:RNA polymerase sigma factor (sigma-70 family)
MDPVESFKSLRGILFSIAYRMLGSVSEAEDIVQEAFLRQQRALAEGIEVDSPRAYLSAVVTRLSIDQLRSARARREVYVGEWLPEPLLTDGDTGLDPAMLTEQADSLSLAFLVLLEQLNPVERAVFLLHDVFGYGYDEIVRIVSGGGLGSRRRGGSASGLPRGSSQPCPMATSIRSSTCSPRMPWSTATVAARAPPGRVRSLAATASVACSRAWVRSSRATG